MNDRDCIICEFTNEGESLAVGFRAWLCEKFNDEDIEEIIKSGQTVTIKWPSNVEVVPASKMQKKLKNCIWQQSVAKILAHGDWTSMCNIRENCIKYGIPNPSKEERKLIKKKVTDDSSDEEDIVKNKASTSKDANKESIMYNRRKEILKRCQETKKTNTILDDSGEKLSERDLLKELSFLREKNKKLEEDNRRLRALRAVNENLSNIQDMSKRVKKDLQEMKDMLHEMNNNAKIKSKITCENVPVSQLKHDDNNEENLNTFLFDNIELTNHNHFCDNIDGDQLIKEADILIDTTVDTSTLEPSSAINSNEQAKLIDLDGSARVMVSEVQINRCNHTSVSKLTSDLMSVVFSQTDLANSSVTGKVANIHKKKEGVKAKAKLDPLKVDAIKSNKVWKL
ncbi:uncharacterized protein LOC105204312 isoform X3 [Solenopsis invicta]|uniref:uncharacterized protein LOC105204312 isoform X3 n=1 Tax=Solenopsis invicta TaxID=13686 RepID=UPI00193E8922|nr:uncharacterized protein LOC105204312 isoform X3 [Solenopsis invicta]